MFKMKDYLMVLVFAFCVVWFTGAADLAAESPDEPAAQPVANVSIGSNGIGWTPKVPYGRLVLTVSTPDGPVFRKIFQGGSTPFLDVSDIDGNYLADGLYMYELRVIPAIRRDRKSQKPGEQIHTPRALLQSGSFRVQKRQFVVPDPLEPGAGAPALPQAGDDIAVTQDICYYDDLIVDGSFCVGFDCTCDLDFGFNTIVLMENNLRIFFDDTSTAGSYPNNDWKIIINDSTNGGASYFSVQDTTAGRRVFTLEAGAPSHSLYVDDRGRVGFGTSTPALELHVVDGDSPALRLQQDGSGGYEAQTWDVAGNETNFFVRDITHGSLLPFRIRPNAPTSSLFIDTDGDIGMGTSSPDYPLHLEDGNGATGVFEDTTNGTQAQISAGTNYVFIGSKTDNDFRLTVNDSPHTTLTTDGYMGIGNTSPGHPIVVTPANGAYLNTSGDWVNPSRRELKENIAHLSSQDALETLNGLHPVRFNYKVDKEKERVGFIAEDVPELVATKDKDGMVPMDVVAVLTKVVKEQQKTISELKKEITALKKKIEK